MASRLSYLARIFGFLAVFCQALDQKARFQHIAHHFEMIAVPGELAFQIDQIGRRGASTAACYVECVGRSIVVRSLQSAGEVRLDDGKLNIFGCSARRWSAPTPDQTALRRFRLANNAQPPQIKTARGRYPRNAGLSKTNCGPPANCEF